MISLGHRAIYISEEVAADPLLPATAKVLYGALHALSDADGLISAGLRDLAAIIGESTQATKAAMQKLERRNLLIVRDRGKPGGVGTYHVLWPHVSALQFIDPLRFSDSLIARRRSLQSHAGGEQEELP